MSLTARCDCYRWPHLETCATQRVVAVRIPPSIRVTSIARYPKLNELRGQLREVIASHAGQVPLAGVLGVLRIIEHELLQEHEG